MIVRLLRTKWIGTQHVCVLGGTTGETTGIADPTGSAIQVKWDIGLKVDAGRVEDLYEVMDVATPEELENAE